MKLLRTGKERLHVCGLDLQVRMKRGWAHVTFQYESKPILEAFIAIPNGEHRCWEECLKRYDQLVAQKRVPCCRPVPSMPTGSPWCASLSYWDFNLLTVDQVRALALLERATAWAAAITC